MTKVRIVLLTLGILATFASYRLVHEAGTAQVVFLLTIMVTIFGPMAFEPQVQGRKAQ